MTDRPRPRRTRGATTPHKKMDITHTDTNTRERMADILRDWLLLRSGGRRPEWCYVFVAAVSFLAATLTAANRVLFCAFGAICLAIAAWLPLHRKTTIRRMLDAIERAGSFSEPTTARLTDETMELVQGDSFRMKKPWRAFGNEFAFVPHGLLVLTDGIFSASIGNELVETAGREELAIVLERAGLRPRKPGLSRAEIVRAVLAALLGFLLACFLLRD